MNNPPVTWLMPVRNGMPCIRETLASIAAQHYDNHRLLVWDNGSTDGTIEELRQWVPSKIPGRIVHNQPMGLGSSLAALVRQADTEYCARIDADDINRPERLVRQVTFPEEHPAVGIVGSQAQAIDEKGSKVECRPAPTADAEIRWRTRWLTSFFHPSVLFRRSVVLAAGNYRNLKPYEDQELWIRMSNITEMRNLPEQLIEYRRTQT
ncbi:MAG: glycosyltransferase, partial [Acidobacteriaceae bacterium]|nr:glycosyltransferase [Acidobacteriaceae bacterium]